MPLRRAFIEEAKTEEVKSLLAGLAARGVPVELFTEKRLRRRQLPVARDTLVAGFVPVVEAALSQLGVEVPEANDYPECLRGFLRRRVWASTVGRVTHEVLEGTSRPMFVKPRDRVKRFTGFVLEGLDDLFRFEGSSRQARVLCSEVVSWRSEWRVYVVRGRVVGTRCYKGDVSRCPDEALVAEALTTLARVNRSPSGFGIDFGVLDTGETALVEMNDGYGLGNYGLADDLYTDLIVSRWCELAGC